MAEIYFKSWTDQMSHADACILYILPRPWKLTVKALNVTSVYVVYA